LTVFAWIAACALTPFLLGTMVQGLIIFNYDTYVYERWHGSLLAWVFVLVPVLWNIYARRLLVILELIGGVCHIVFFICQVSILGVMARRSTNEFVWETLIHDVSGWENKCTAFSIGLLTVVFPLSGFDGVLHMSTFCFHPEKLLEQGGIKVLIESKQALK
jgi:choline transport protein